MMGDPNIIRSPLCRQVTSDGIAVQVEIYRAEDGEGWVLEIVDEEGGSTIWQDTFPTDAAAYEEFVDGMKELGPEQLIHPEDDDLATVH